MELQYDAQRLVEVLNDFTRATGINCNFLRPDGKRWRQRARVPNPFCRAIQSSPCGKGLCRASDRRLLDVCEKTRHVETHVCHAGLVDAAVPILCGGEIAGYIIMGPMRSRAEFDVSKRLIAPCGLREGKAAERYAALPLYDDTTIESIANIAAILAKYIMFESMLKPSDSFSLGRTVEYIERNLTEPLTTERLVKDTHMSKSALFRAFHETYGCTPGEYVSRRRVERAKQMLEDGTLSVGEIAAALDFSSVSYFDRVFRKITGVPPLSYRNRHRSDKPAQNDG